MNALKWILMAPGILWRYKRAVAVAVLVSPLALTGSLELFAVNGLALGYLAFTTLRLMQTKGK